MGKAPKIIVIGASLGGVAAVRAIAAALPSDFAAAVFVVLHIGAHKSQLPWLLNQHGPLKAVHPNDRSPIQTGQIYLAPPDRHMVLERGMIRLTKGPRENWARPAIDPLFRSAARAYGPDVIGVILTGGLNDGTAGLYEIKQRGGTSIVQDPDDATEPSMPRSAMKYVAVDYCRPLDRIPALLTDLVATMEPARRVNVDELPSAGKRRQDMTAEYKLDQPVAITCPDCGGALRQTKLGTLSQFRCHIGHVYTAEVMMEAQFTALEGAFEATLRVLGERRELCRQRADDARAREDATAATQWHAAMEEAEARSLALRDLLEAEWIHPGEAKIAERAALPFERPET